MIASRALDRAAVVLAALLVASCNPFTTPEPPRTPSPVPTSSRPRFELSTYQYALQTKGKIRVAVRDGTPGFAPLSSGSTQGKVEGFEPDLARELARAIWGPNDDPDTHITWISVDSATSVAALTSNQADVTFAGLLIDDPSNSKTIDLSDVYLHTGPRLLVKKTNDQIKEISDVANGEQTVCAVKGGRPEQELKKITNNGAKVLELDTLAFCTQALAQGAADAIASDETILYGLMLKDQALKLVGNRFTDDRYGIGMKKNAGGDREGFREFVNTALLKIVADRTWARIYEKDITPVSGDKKQIPTD